MHLHSDGFSPDEMDEDFPEPFPSPFVASTQQVRNMPQQFNSSVQNENATILFGEPLHRAVVRQVGENQRDISPEYP
jgi:hypothetical protein